MTTVAEPACYGAVRELLAKRGYKPKKIYSVESAGDGGATGKNFGLGYGATVVTFTTATNQPRTGYLWCEVDWEKEDIKELLHVEAGW